MTSKPVLSVRLSADIRRGAERAAKRDRRSLASWVEKVLAERLEADGILKPTKEKAT